MSSFDERVQRIVDASLEEHRQEHSEALEGTPSRYTLDDVYNKLISLSGLSAEIKSEVFKVEHNLPPKEEEPKEQEDEEQEPDPNTIRKVIEWWRKIKAENQAVEDEMGWSVDWDQVFRRWMQTLGPIASLIKSTNEKTKFVISNIIRSWMLDEKLKPIKKDLATIQKQTKDSRAKLESCCLSMNEGMTQALSDLSEVKDYLPDLEHKILDVGNSVTNVDTLLRETKNLLHSDAEDIALTLETIIQNETNDVRAIRRDISDLKEQLTECCGNMANTLSGVVNRLIDIKSEVDRGNSIVEGIDQTTARIEGTTDTINHKIDLLDPVTNANNVLEILQRQKTIQSQLDEIRRLL